MSRITLTEEEIQLIKKEIAVMVAKKMESDYYKDDAGKIEKRFFSGFAAEVAVEKYLGIKFTDRTAGKSSTYNKEDIQTLGVGVKVADIGNAHLVPSKPKYGEILVTRISDSEYDIIGFASDIVLADYADSELIKSKAVKDRGDKKGFNRYDLVKPFNNVNHLKALIAQSDRIKLLFYTAA